MPILCAASLAVNPVTEKIFAYDDPVKVVSAKTSDIFSNSQPVLCPIRTCQLMKSDCSDINSDVGIAQDQTDGTSIVLASSSDQEGQSFMLCFQCSNLYQFIQKINFKIVQ